MYLSEAEMDNPGLMKKSRWKLKIFMVSCLNKFPFQRICKISKIMKNKIEIEKKNKKVGWKEGNYEI